MLDCVSTSRFEGLDTEGRKAMNVKRFVLACVGVYLVYQVLSFIINMVTLGLAHAWVLATVFIAVVSGAVLAAIYKPAEA